MLVLTGTTERTAADPCFVSGSSDRLPVVSFDVFFQGFIAGESSARGCSRMRDVLLPHAIETKGSFLRLRVGDGEADIHLSDDGMIANHVTGRDSWDLLVRGAQAANWVILPAGGPTCLTQPGQRDELPDELADDVTFVETGADLRTLIEAR